MLLLCFAMFSLGLSIRPASKEQVGAMNEQMQALCFFAGANSIFYGEKLLTTSNPLENEDLALFNKLGIRPEERSFEHVQRENLFEQAHVYYDATNQ